MNECLEQLNEMQAKAVLQTEGPVLILAGAGSGKTRVLTNRMAHIIKDLQVPAYHILAITFTNKAAAEMRDRVDRMIGVGAKDAWVSTFHSACLRILRRHADRIGYHSDFTIYDPEDQKSLIKKIFKDENVDEHTVTPKTVLHAIGHAKNEMIDPDTYANGCTGDFVHTTIAKFYREYEQRMRQNQAMDFDDILLNIVVLFTLCPDVLEKYQRQFRYIMVDEYQDTNTVQYKIIKMLAAQHHNLCVVGDDDQSIYKFRGANIRNILDFETDYSEATVIRLEENYRSTGNILNAANAVVKHNVGRKDKTLWTRHETGDRITVKVSDDENAEASWVAKEIIRLKNNGKTLRDVAILFRTNAQSRALEEALLRENVAYRLYAGVPFYQRKEIKDLLCYLRLVSNDFDYLAAERILNVPKRGLGQTFVSRLLVEAQAHQWGITQTIVMVRDHSDFKRASNALESFSELICGYRAAAAQPDADLNAMLDDLIDKIRYVDYLRDDDPDRFDDRMENIDELKNRIEAYEEQAQEPSLSGLIEELSLVAAIDAFDENTDSVALMTLHSAKGLEFPVVFITGMEEGLFPSYLSLNSDSEDDVEEERRLCYVGITRTEQRLYLTRARARRIRGLMEVSEPSRFLKEIPNDLLNTIEPERKHLGSSFGSLSAPKPISSTGSIHWRVGDQVMHRKFGLGIIKSVTPLNADAQVEVSFEKVGDKKLLAGLAGLSKIEG